MKPTLCYELISIALFFSLCSKTNGQSPDSPPWAWAKSVFGSSAWIYINAIAIDPSESEEVYIAGDFEGFVDFDPGPETFNLYSFAHSIFIAKYDRSGNFLWAKAMPGEGGGVGSAYASSIVIDPMEGSVYTTGEFYETIDFDPGIDEFSLTAIPQGCQELDVCGDIFISKLDRDGNFIWALRVGGPQDDSGSSLVVDDGGSGDIYLTGYFSETVDFDPGAEVSNITSVGGHDVFISRVNSSGQILWTKPIGGIGQDVGHKIAFDPSGNGKVYVIGTFADTVDFNPGSENYFLNAATNRESFITKFDSSGNFLWAKHVAKANFNDLTIDHSGSGDIYTTGYFWDTCDFNSAEEIYNLIAEEESTDIFILKLSDSGTFKWVKSMGGSSHDAGTGIAVQPGNSVEVYITGYFKDICDFNPGVDTFNITSAGKNDIFISNLDSAGLFKWVKVIKGVSDEFSPDIATKQHGVYLTGLFFSSPLFFDTIAIRREGWGPALFIAKLESEITTKVMSLAAEKYQMIIYPNPAINELNIEIDEGEFFNVDITLYNVLGEIVYFNRGENIGQKKTIDISSLSTGIYFVEVNMDGKRVIEKVVKD